MKSVYEEIAQEKLKLHVKIYRLRAFLNEPQNIRNISDKQVDLLGQQLHAMNQYYGCLNLRLEDMGGEQCA